MPDWRVNTTPRSRSYGPAVSVACSFGLAHAAEQCFHGRPETLPLLAFLLGQPGEGVLCADAGKVVVDLPMPQLLPDLGLGHCVAALDLFFPPGEVLAEPFEGLAAPEGACLVVQPVCVLPLGATRHRSGAGGIIASAH